MDRLQPGSGRHRWRVGAVASTAVAGAVALALSVAPVSGAAVTHVTAKKAPTLASLEAKLKSLAVAPSSSVTLSEAGSSLFYPLFHEWGAASPWSTLTINSGAGGSSTGVTDAEQGLVNIGASDPPLTSAQAATGVINIPVVVAGQAVMYNLPGLKSGTHLHINSTLLSEIFSGQVTTWNASQIKALNPGVKLPSTPIVTIHRSDGSGDTNLFTTYIYDGDPSSFVVGAGGPANTISWPSTPGQLAASGNSGILSTLQQTPGGISYLGLSYLRQALQAGLGYGLLENGRKNYVGPTTVNMQYEMNAYTSIPSNGVQSLEFSKAKAANFGYPDINFEYAIVKPNQSSSTTAAAIKSLLAWGMNPKGGAAPSFLTSLYFLPMPAAAIQTAIGLLNQIS